MARTKRSAVGRGVIRERIPTLRLDFNRTGKPLYYERDCIMTRKEREIRRAC